MKLKLGKFLSESGVASRRRSKQMVLSGRVKVNGKIAESAGMIVDPEKDIIEVDGRRVELKTQKVYIMLHKPPGYLSTTVSDRGEPTIMDLIPIKHTRLYPVGRLDKDTEGLLIITNDGDLTYKLTHPKHNVDKVYLVWVIGRPSEESLDRLRSGIMLDDGMTAPAKVEVLKTLNGVTCIKMTIHEGRKRQIKRMFSAIGHSVLRLKRIKLGPLEIGDLPSGKFRYLSEQEVTALKEYL